VGTVRLFKPSSRFKFLLLPSRVSVRPPASNASRSAAKFKSKYKDIFRFESLVLQNQFFGGGVSGHLSFFQISIWFLVSSAF